MKVGHTPDIPVVISSTGSQKSIQGEQATKKSTSVGQQGASVSVSSLAKSLDMAGKSDADIDMDKVQAMRSALESGEFQVNAGAIADKLLANAQEVLQRRQSQ